MTAVTFYGLKSCDTCRKALKALSGRNVTVVDVRVDGVPEATLRTWVETLGAAALVNRKSTTWRGLREDQRAMAETEDGAVSLLAANPTLIKRPVIEHAVGVFVGWSAETQSALGL